MATLEEEKNKREALHKALEELNEIKAIDLIRADELGRNLSFAAGVPVFERVLNLFHDLYECNLDNIPFNTLNNLMSQATNAINTFKNIKTFSAEKYPQNIIGQRDTFIADLRNQYDNYFQAISPIISYSIRKGTDFKALENNARAVVSSIESLKKEYEEKQINLIKSMESTLNKVRQAAAEVGVAQHATHFKDEAEFNSKQSNRWMIATGIASFATIGWGVACFFIQPPQETMNIVQYTIAKLIILSALYYSLVWCAKNYSAHRHNFVVNKHRQNALSTFETFIKAAENDADTKNAVLLQATQSIFSSQPSGYVNKETESESPNRFIEIMRSVGSAVKK